MSGMSTPLKNGVSCRQKALSGQRLNVLTILQTHKKALKAYDILALLQKEDPTIAPTIVYRALDYLITHGYAHKLEIINAFVACDHAHPDHHSLILVCDTCQQTHEIPQHAITNLHDLAAETEFKIFDQDIAIKGLCKRCEQHA